MMWITILHNFFTHGNYTTIYSNFRNKKKPSILNVVHIVNKQYLAVNWYVSYKMFFKLVKGKNFSFLTS